MKLNIPWTDLRDVFEEMVGAGTSPAVAARKIAKAIDDLLPLDKLVAGEAGEVLEAVDRPIARLAVRIALQYTTIGKTPTIVPVDPPTASGQ